MNVHEYQAKQIFRAYAIPVPQGAAIFKPEDAAQTARKLVAETGNEVVVVKAQIHAGGRGKAGGVKVVTGVRAAEEAAKQLFGKVLVTHQTGPAGKKVLRVLIEQGLAIERELYVAAVLDRETRRIVVMASTEGGVEIEEVAAQTPEKIVKVIVDPVVGLAGYQARQLAFALGLGGSAFKEFGSLAASLVKLFEAEDCSQAEINPLIVTKDNHVLALDAKLNFDDNADFRHKTWGELRDLSEENPTETEAKAAGLSYIQLEGNIGCLVNGAGLAMATMDIIKHFGGEPANFLDVGGGASREAVQKAFSIILDSSDVKGIFVNIFGGIMKCDIIADGIVAASRALGLEVPLVVRLEGTNVEQGRRILSESQLAITSASSMADGARKIVEQVSAGRA
ncbi:MAG: ADP-forming succinate--CoA ligase subunit beta [Proteobacteria bacterium]|nr:ADP-forming succinate--CoA ligase subunit beta [Pseudomonadota bacterium]